MTQLNKRRNFEEPAVELGGVKKGEFIWNFFLSLHVSLFHLILAGEPLCGWWAGTNHVLLLFVNVLHLGTWLRERDILSQERYSHWKKMMWTKLFFSIEKNAGLSESFSLFDENIWKIFVLGWTLLPSNATSNKKRKGLFGLKTEILVEVPKPCKKTPKVV